MRIALVGATGNIGRVIAAEALARGHEVTAVVRDASRLDYEHERLKVSTGDVLDPGSVATAAAGHDVLVSAVGARGADPQVLPEIGRGLVEAVRRSGVDRVVVVGGAGGLEAPDGGLVWDMPDYPDWLKPLAKAHDELCDALRESDVDWTYFSPPRSIQPGERTGRYRLERDRLVVDAEGKSEISREDYAKALVDELEQPQFRRSRFTIGY
jgi:putative NADH-flavin reductase